MKTTKKIAVILSGCGRADGSEIHESTLTLYFICKFGAEYEIFAPDINQHHVINHLTNEEMSETRNVLVESARIARGKIKPLNLFDSSNFDALIMPGGNGAAKNLFTYVTDGVKMKIQPDVKNAILKMHEGKKPIGALCIMPVLIAKVLQNVTLTIGQDNATAKDVEKMGAKNRITKAGEIIVDKENKLVTTPCYMLDSSICEVGDGIEKLVRKVLDLID
ncbi:isoprenoid biosynthesis glyoxalase ElbB [Bacteroidota bacterium]